MSHWLEFWMLLILSSEAQIIRYYFYSVLSLWIQSSYLTFHFSIWSEDSVHGSYFSVLACIFLLQSYFVRSAPGPDVLYLNLLSVLYFLAYIIVRDRLKEALKRNWVFSCIWIMCSLSSGALLVKQQGKQYEYIISRKRIFLKNVIILKLWNKDTKTSNIVK